MIHFSINLWHKSLFSHVINLPYSTDALWATSGIAFTCNNFSNVPLTGVRQTKSSSTATRPKQNESNSMQKKTLTHSFRSLPPLERDGESSLSLPLLLSLSHSLSLLHFLARHFIILARIFKHLMQTLERLAIASPALLPGSHLAPPPSSSDPFCRFRCLLQASSMLKVIHTN